MSTFRHLARRQSLFLRPAFAEQQIICEQEYPYGDRGIGQIEYRPHAEINEIHYIMEPDAVNQVPDSTAQLERQCQAYEPRHGSPSADNDNNRGYDYYGDERQHSCPRLEEAECPALIVYQGETHDIAENGHGGSECESAYGRIFARLVKDDDQKCDNVEVSCSQRPSIISWQPTQYMA